MSDTYTKLQYHLVFSTKQRAALIESALRDELYAYFGGILRGQGGILLVAGGMPDHVHLLAAIRPDMRAYILGQEEHHRTISSEEEFRTLLRRHGLSIDE
ncbi:MAG TPA: transposase [Thermoanaerobaculia bacterium]|nr:transposase [Thermoanaerobaculia bacterium]